LKIIIIVIVSVERGKKVATVRECQSVVVDIIPVWMNEARRIIVVVLGGNVVKIVSFSFLWYGSGS
jgi:hypothetical protein